MTNDIEDEIWKDIRGYEGLYSVSNYGRIKSLIRNDTKNGVRLTERVIKTLSANGHGSIHLCKNGVIKHLMVKSLVFAAFFESRAEPTRPWETILHKDGNKLNNNVNNLYMREDPRGNTVFFPIPNTDGYEISMSGKVFCNSSAVGLLCPRINNHGYWCVNIQRSDRSYPTLVHRLLATTFIPNPKNKPCINHINGIKSDNRLENLEWVTYSENSIHSRQVLKNTYKKDPSKIRRGEKSSNHKLTEADVFEILSLLDQGVKYLKISENYPVAEDTIGSISRGESWIETTNKYKNRKHEKTTEHSNL